MNAFNRILVVLLLLVAIVSCTIVLVVPVPSPVVETMAQQLVNLAELVDFKLYSFEWLVRVIVGICLALPLDGLLVFLLILELRRPSQKAIRIEKAAGGDVLISIASIADRIKHEVGQLSGVLRTKPKIAGKRKGVQVELNVEAEAGVNVPEKAEQIVEVARRVVEEDMGLKLARLPKINLRVASYSKGQKSPVRSRQVSPVTPPAPPVQPEVVVPVEPESEMLVEPVETEMELPDLPEDFGESL